MAAGWKPRRGRGQQRLVESDAPSQRRELKQPLATSLADGQGDGHAPVGVWDEYHCLGWGQAVSGRLRSRGMAVATAWARRLGREGGPTLQRSRRFERIEWQGCCDHEQQHHRPRASGAQLGLRDLATHSSRRRSHGGQRDQRGAILVVRRVWRGTHPCLVLPPNRGSRCVIPPAGEESQRPFVDGPPRPQPRDSVLDLPGLGSGGRELRGVHRIWPDLPQQA